MSRRLTPVAASKRACTSRVHLLVDARDARQKRRTYLRERLGDAQRIGDERDREPDVRAEEEHQPPVVVREREVQEHHVVFAVVALLHPVDDRRHLEVVAVREHAALRRPGRARRVDDREEVVLADRRRRVVERRRVRRREVATVRREAFEVVVREDVLQRRRARLATSSTFASWAASSQTTPTASECARAGSPRQRAELEAYTGMPDRSDVCEREVDERPVEAVPREERDVVALPASRARGSRSHMRGRDSSASRHETSFQVSVLRPRRGRPRPDDRRRSSARQSCAIVRRRSPVGVAEVAYAVSVTL